MKINLLPLARQKQPHRYRAVILMAVVALCVSVPLVFFSYQLVSDVGSLRREVALLETRLGALAPLGALLQEQARLEQELARIQGIAVPEQANLVPLLDEVARLLPDRVFVGELALEGQRLSLRGVTPTYALAAEFLRVLAGSELFATPVLSALHVDEAGYRFDIAAELRVVAP